MTLDYAGLKYEKISKYTCICCGKINVPVFEYGWINPYCTDCFRQEFKKNGRKAIASKIDSYIIETPRLTRNMIVKIYSSNGMKRRKIDLSDTLRKLGVNPDKLPTIEDIADSGNE